MAPIRAQHLGPQELVPQPVPVTPSEERWREMSQAERERFVESVNSALSDPIIAMSEGRPHKKAKSRAIDMLGLHFRAMGRHIYLAEELAVLYPGTPGFTPDVMAVLDVEEPEDDQRSAWVVADEGKGLDWVLEVLWAGNRKKDLEDNVERYASLGIPEYFIYDQKQQRIVGYRLPEGAKRYQPILAQGGLYRSNVLGIDLAVVGRSLRFYQGTAELYDTKHLIERLEGILQSLEERADEAQRERDQAQHERDQAQHERDQAQRNADQVQHERDLAQRVNEKLISTTRQNIVALLGARGVSCSDAFRARIDACSDADFLGEWFTRALHATSEDDVFGTNGTGAASSAPHIEEKR